MKITVESTDKIVELLNGSTDNGMPARIWEGETDTGIPIHCYITRIAVNKESDCSQFEKELEECRPPTDPGIKALPLSMIL